MRIVSKVCAFTGHRPQKLPWRDDETDSRCMALKAVLTEQIKSLIDSGFTQFLSGMAEGTDTFCSEIVLSQREKNPALKLHCILPCTTQADDWPASSRELYHSVLEQADSIVYVSRNYHKNCMLERNHFLVEHSNILLAVYNGAWRSGTGSTMRYARKLGKEIILIDPGTLAISCELNAP